MREYITCVAIKRDGVVRHMGPAVREHHRLRQIINPPLTGNHKMDGDVDGFMTCQGRFLTRAEARDVAIASRQLHERWKTSARDPLSSDLEWFE